MSYKPNIPIATDFLSVSQVDILNNFTVLNTAFGIDHYDFADLTADRGKHNQITLPEIVGAVDPTTLADETKFYALQKTANLGLLQFSRGEGDAVPTPVTSFQSPNTAQTINFGTAQNILDFTGMPNSIFILYSVYTVSTTESLAIWMGQWKGAPDNSFVLASPSNPVYRFGASGTSVSMDSSGNILRMNNTSGSINATAFYWTLKFQRIWT